MIVILRLLFVCREYRAMSPMRGGSMSGGGRSEAGERCVKTERVMTSLSEQKKMRGCLWCMQGKWELVFSYADELLLFAVCLFRGICTPGLKIKALMVCNSRSGSHVEGSLLSQHVFFMKERWFMSIVWGEHSCLWGTVSMTCAISILEGQG